jgi:hypothetical protein
MFWLLPFSDSLTSRDRRWLNVSTALTFVIIAGTIVAAVFEAITGLGGEALEAPVRDWAPSLAYILVAGIMGLRALRVTEGRLAWGAISLGLTLYSLGNVLYAFFYQPMDSLPVPAWTDAFWLALYPLSYVGIAMLARQDSRSLPAGVWLDGIIAGLGMAAFGAAVVFGVVLSNAAAGLGAMAAVTTLAYPVADFVLAALVIGVLSLRGWRLDRTWAMLGGGFLALWLADSIFLIKLANGATEASVLANVFYLGGGGAAGAGGVAAPAGGSAAEARGLVGAGRTEHLLDWRARPARDRPLLATQRSRRDAGGCNPDSRVCAGDPHLPRRARVRGDEVPGDHGRPHVASEPAPVHCPA